MSKKIIQPPKDLQNPYIKSFEEYEVMYRESIEKPKEFFAKMALENLDWFEKFSSVHNESFSDTKWFEGGKINVAHNCIDRHLKTNSEKIALIWEGDDPNKSQEISYKKLHEEVCRLANILKKLGAKKGSRVCIYMPMIPEAIYSMLACARIGAIHSVVFGGFSAESLKDRILDADCRIVITADEGVRGGKSIPLKSNVDKALESCPQVSACLVVRRTGAKINWVHERDHYLSLIHI